MSRKWLKSQLRALVHRHIQFVKCNGGKVRGLKDWGCFPPCLFGMPIKNSFVECASVQEVVWDPKDHEEGAGDGASSSHRFFAFLFLLKKSSNLALRISSRLLIKTAILMPESKEGEVTIVEVETIGFNKTKVDRMLLLLNSASL